MVATITPKCVVLEFWTMAIMKTAFNTSDLEHILPSSVPGVGIQGVLKCYGYSANF